MRDDSSDKNVPSDEELVAYLDGELDAESRGRVENNLAVNAEARRRLHELEQTWDLLDELGKTPPSARFTDTTLEMAALAVRQEIEQSRTQPSRWPQRGWRLFLGLATAFLMGFIIVWLLRSDPNQKLLDDLCILEHLDEYHQVGDIAFLNLLRDDKLFTKSEEEPAAGTDANIPSSVDQRRAYVEQMTAGEKSQLKQAQERFEAMPRAERSKLRQLEADLEKSSHAAELRQIMRNYWNWTKTLPSFARAELTELPPADRLKNVVLRLKEERNREGGRRMDGKDVEAIVQWLRDYVASHETQLMASLPEQQRTRLEGLSEPMRRRWLFIEALRMPQGDGERELPLGITPQDLDSLRKGLTNDLQKQLEKLTPAMQWRRIVMAMRFSMRQNVPGRGWSGMTLSDADHERLAEFFEHGLNDEERARLLSLPGDEMQRELQILYTNSRSRPAENIPNRPGGPRRGRGGDWSPGPHQTEDTDPTGSR